MAISFGFYFDSLKQIPLTTAAVFSMNADGSTGPVDTVLYLGSNTASRKAQAASNPGVAHLSVSIEDSNPTGGQPANAVKLALSAIGLDSATPGAALDLGVVELLSDSAPLAIHVRVTDQTHVVGNYGDLALKTCDLFETSVV